MDEYNEETNFKSVLSEITLDDVHDAIRRAKAMNEATNRGDRS